MCASAADSSPGGCSYRGRSGWMNAETRWNGTTEFPCVRGICSLISAMMIRAASAAALAVSTEVPSVQLPWRSGGESWRMAMSRGTSLSLKRPGMSERKIGMKSARPSSIALRSGAPVKSEIDVNCPAFSGAAKGAGPFVWMW